MQRANCVNRLGSRSPPYLHWHSVSGLPPPSSRLSRSIAAALPFSDPTKLVTLGDTLEGVDYGGDAPGVTAPGVLTYIRETHAFSSMGGYTPSSYELSGAGDPAQINASRLTATMFPTLGVSPLMGRTFTQREDESSQQVAVLSYQTWRSRFHADPHILGQKILLDRKPYEVIGVMPRDFEFPLVPGHLNRSELWVPMSFTQVELVQGVGAWSYYLVGRLPFGMLPEQAQQDALGAAREIMRKFLLHSPPVAFIQPSGRWKSRR